MSRWELIAQLGRRPALRVLNKTPVKASGSSLVLAALTDRTALASSGISRPPSQERSSSQPVGGGSCEHEGMVAVPTAAMASSLLLRPRASSFRRALPSPPPSSRRALPATLRQAASTQQKQQLPGLSARSEGERRPRPAGTRLYSLAPYPLLLAALLPGAEPVAAVFAPFVELVKTWDLPGWLVHWGHPGNMAVVLFAMGGYGTYLGFRIKLSDDPEEKAKAKDLHPKLLAGMFFFFALGATGGVTALLTSDKPIFESPHAVTGVIGLALLTIQSILPKLFEGNPGLRTTHGLLGSGIMTLFLIHAAFGLQLGLSF